MSKYLRKMAVTLCFMLLSLTAFGSSVTWAADGLTAQEKFDKLVEAGIFTGFPDGTPRLDNQATRAEMAKILAKVLELEEDASRASSIYQDLALAEWAAGYIGAVTPKYMEGYGDGIFAPGDTLTMEQLAAVLVRVLDLEVDQDATVDGNVSDWAKQYVAAAVAAGVLQPQADYTTPASRSQLVDSSYNAHEVYIPCMNEPPLSLDGAVLDLENDDRKLVLSYTAPIDAESIQLNNFNINGATLDPDKDTFVLSDDKTELTISLNKEFSLEETKDASIQMSGIATVCGKKSDAPIESSETVPVEIINAPKPAPVIVPYYPPTPPSNSTPVIAVDTTKIITVTEATYVPVTSSHTTDLYYALLPALAAAPTTAELIDIENMPLSEALESGRISTTGSQEIVLTNLFEGMDYKLYIVGTNGSHTSNMLSVDINTDKTSFTLQAIIDVSDEEYLRFCLYHTPETVSGTVYYVVAINPLHDIETPDDLVQLVQSNTDNEIIIYSGQESWSGISDQITIGANGGEVYNIYVVLEVNGFRLMLDDLLNYW